MGIRMLMVAALGAALSSLAWGQGSAVLKWRNDAGNTGWQSEEGLLSPANVNPRTFGRQFSHAVSGQVYAQPLYVPGVDVPGFGIRNIVIVATQRNMVYAFDADSNTAPFDQPLWSRSLGQAVTSEAVECFDTVPWIGITSTPIVDRATNTLYVAPKVQGPGQEWRVYALDLLTGATRPGWENIRAQAAIAGTNGDASGGVLPFQPDIQNQRTGLVLINGRLYLCFSAHCGSRYHRIHGWVFSFDTANPSLPPRLFNVTPDLAQPGVPGGAGGGIWMAGSSPVVDGNDIIVVASNGPFDRDLGGRNHGNSVLRLNFDSLTPEGLGRVIDYFSPANQEQLQGNVDLGSGGIILPPPQNQTSTPRIVVLGGKDGRLIVLNADNLGGFTGRTNQGAQNNWLQAIQFPNGFWSSPSYFGSTGGNYVVANAVGDRLRVFSILADTANGNRARLDQVAETSISSGYPSSTPTVSSNAGNASSAIAWMLNRGTNALHAFEPLTGRELFNTNMVWDRDGLPSVLKFTVPTVAAGRVYVGSDNVFSVYGVNPPSLGVFSRLRLSSPADGAVGVRTQFHLATTDDNGAPVRTSMTIPVHVRLGDGSVRPLTTISLARQSGFTLSRTFTAPGAVDVIFGRGTFYETTVPFTVHSNRAPFNHFAISGPLRIEAGREVLFQIAARNASGRSVPITANVPITLAQADGTVNVVATARFQNSTTALVRVRPTAGGSAMVSAEWDQRSGTAPLDVIADVRFFALAQFGNWGGSTRPIVRLEFRRPGSTTVLHRFELPIQDDRSFSVMVPVGIYDVSMKSQQWLRQTLRRVFVPTRFAITFNGPQRLGLINGDVNDDNMVDSADLIAVGMEMGRASTGTRGHTDLNGDGIVNSADMRIVQDNLGRVGDR